MSKIIACLIILTLGTSADLLAQVGLDPRSDDACPVRIDTIRVETSGFAGLLSNDNRLFGSIFSQRYSIRNEALPNPLSSMAIWLAGDVGNDAKISGGNWVSSAFVPGMFRSPNESYDCTSRDIFNITRGDIEQYHRTGVANGNLRRWPAHLGAPVVDGDGISDNYNLEDGDLPALRGDELYWWLMSDWSGRHPSALDLEVAVSAFVFHGGGALANSLFLSYDFANAGTEAIHDAIAAVFTTPEFPDELAGVDTTRAVLFAYNANDSITGQAPDVTPSVGIVLLSSQVALERNDYPPAVRSAFVELRPGGAPDNYREYLYTLNGYDARNQEVRFGAYSTGPVYSGCHPTGPQTLITYPGDPVSRSYWSMERPIQEGDACIVRRADGTRYSNVEAMNVSTSMNTIEPGQTATLSFAVVWALGDDRLDSVRKLFSYADLLHEQREVLLAPSIESESEPQQLPDLLLSAVSPNPADTRATLEYSIPSQAHIRIRVFDLLGRVIMEPVNEVLQAGAYSVQLDVSALTPGPYFLRYEIANRAFTRSLVVM